MITKKASGLVLIFTVCILVSLCMHLTSNADTADGYELDNNAKHYFSDCSDIPQESGIGLTTSNFGNSASNSFVVSPSVNTYVDAQTGRFTCNDKLKLTNNGTEYRIKVYGVKLKLKDGYIKLPGKWKLTKNDGTIFFEGEVGDSLEFSEPIYIETGSVIELNVTCDKSGILEQRYIDRSPFSFVFSYKESVPVSYAMYKENETDNQLTFYYDDMNGEREGKLYDVESGTLIEQSWISDNKDTLTKIVCDPSFYQFKPTSIAYWFGLGFHRGEISKLHTIDLTYLNTSKCKSMRHAFAYCTNVENYFGFEKLDVSQVSDFAYCFYYNHLAKSLNLSGWDTQSATLTCAQFANAWGEKFPDISNWNLSKVVNASYMFSDSKFVSFCNFSKWDMSSSTNLSNMFSNCTKATEAPDVGNWNTSSLINMDYMFYMYGNDNGGVRFSISMKNWSFAKLTSSLRTFYECNNLEKIYCNSNIKEEIESSSCYSPEMFYHCVLLDERLSSWEYPSDLTYAYPKTETNPDGFFTAC